MEHPYMSKCIFTLCVNYNLVKSNRGRVGSDAAPVVKGVVRRSYQALPLLPRTLTILCL